MKEDKIIGLLDSLQIAVIELSKEMKELKKVVENQKSNSKV